MCSIIMQHFNLLLFLQTLTDFQISTIFGSQYTELICNTTIIHLPASPTYCLGNHANCMVITLATNVYTFPLHKITKNNQLIHTTGLQLSLNKNSMCSTTKCSFFHPHEPKYLTLFINSFALNGKQALLQIGYVSNWRLIQTILHHVS